MAMITEEQKQFSFVFKNSTLNRKTNLFDCSYLLRINLMEKDLVQFTFYASFFNVTLDMGMDVFIDSFSNSNL